MGFTKVNGRWISKCGDVVGPSSGAHAESEDEDQTVVAATEEDIDMEAGGDGVGSYDAGQRAGNMGERITSMSPFERLMLSRKDSFAENQRNLHELCATNFQNFDDRF